MRIALVVALIASALGQQPSGQPFAGQWAADHDGHSVVHLDLRMNAGALVGSIRLADIHLDAKGEVETLLSGLSAATMLIDLTTRSRTLAFSRRDDDDKSHLHPHECGSKEDDVCDEVPPVDVWRRRSVQSLLGLIENAWKNRRTSIG